MNVGTYGLELRSAVRMRRLRRIRIAAGIAGLLLGSLAFVVGREVWRDPSLVGLSSPVAAVRVEPAAGAATTEAAAPSRPVYPLSIVPGGVYSQQDVAAAAAHDAVVAAHYRTLDLGRMQPTTVRGPRTAYVSYRIGSQVFWTRHRIHLTPGETLLTDGQSEIRARCGNRVSDVAQYPVATAEPDLAALDRPLGSSERGASSMAGEASPDAQFWMWMPPLVAGPVGSPLSHPLLIAGMPALVVPGGGPGGASGNPGGSAGGPGGVYIPPVGGPIVVDRRAGGSNPSIDNGSGASAGGPGTGGGSDNGGGPGTGGGSDNGGGPGTGGGSDNGGGPGTGGGSDNGGGPGIGGGSNNGGGPGTGGGSDSGGGPGTGGGTGDDVGPPSTTGGVSIIVDTTGGPGSTTGEAPSVPEPSTLLLMSVGAAAEMIRRARAARR